MQIFIRSGWVGGLLLISCLIWTVPAFGGDQDASAPANQPAPSAGKELTGAELMGDSWVRGTTEFMARQAEKDRNIRDGLETIAIYKQVFWDDPERFQTLKQIEQAIKSDDAESQAVALNLTHLMRNLLHDASSPSPAGPTAPNPVPTSESGRKPGEGVTITDAGQPLPPSAKSGSATPTSPDDESRAHSSVAPGTGVTITEAGGEEPGNLEAPPAGETGGTTPTSAGSPYNPAGDTSDSGSSKVDAGAAESLLAESSKTKETSGRGVAGSEGGSQVAQAKVGGDQAKSETEGRTTWSGRESEHQGSKESSAGTGPVTAPFAAGQETVKQVDNTVKGAQHVKEGWEQLTGKHGEEGHSHPPAGGSGGNGGTVKPGGGDGWEQPPSTGSGGEGTGGSGGGSSAQTPAQQPASSQPAPGSGQGSVKGTWYLVGCRACGNSWYQWSDGSEGESPGNCMKCKAGGTYISWQNLNSSANPPQPPPAWPKSKFTAYCKHDKDPEDKCTYDVNSPIMTADYNQMPEECPSCGSGVILEEKERVNQGSTGL